MEKFILKYFILIRTLIAIAIGAVISIFLIYLISKDPAFSLHSFFLGPLLSRSRLANVIETASPIIFCGIAISVAFQAKQFNVGAEGALYLGAAVGTAFAVSTQFPAFIHIPLGLRIRAVGQNPRAAQSVGINVDRIRLYALLLSGFFGAFGGLYLYMGYVSWFSRDMTAGRGWIAIAAATLGGNQPLGTFLASFLFGTVNALAIYIASLRIPSELIQLIPYLATVIALTVYSARAMKKKARSASTGDGGGGPGQSQGKQAANPIKEDSG